MTFEEIRAELEARRIPSDETLREAVSHAAALAPIVAALVEKAADGVYLLPKQDRLLFFGLHILAAARRTEAYRPLMRLLNRSPAETEAIFGDAILQTIPDIVISVFDGDTGPLVAAIENRDLDGYLRWGLFVALARLAFDGTIGVDFVRAFLDRFDRERLADDDDDSTWGGWAQAILLLGLDDMLDRVRATWQDGRNPEREIDQRDYEERMRHAAAHRDDVTPFETFGHGAIDDPADALSWLDRTKDDENDGEAATAKPSGDPAHDIAVGPEESGWLRGFLEAAQVPELTMSGEELDGFLTGLVVGPETIMPSEYMKKIWGTPDGDGPVFDSAEQAQFFQEIVQRRWNTIARRMEAQTPHAPWVDDDDSDLPGILWADGFSNAIALRPDGWTELIDDPKHGRLLAPIFLLGLEGDRDLEDAPITAELRAAAVASLAMVSRGIYNFWRKRPVHLPFRAPVRRERKIGRNERCPCGSGRKFKNCCGSPLAATRH